MCEVEAPTTTDVLRAVVAAPTNGPPRMWPPFPAHVVIPATPWVVNGEPLSETLRRKAFARAIMADRSIVPETVWAQAWPPLLDAHGVPVVRREHKTLDAHDVARMFPDGPSPTHVFSRGTFYVGVCGRRAP